MVHQARSLTIPIHFLPDFLQISKEHSRIFDIAMRASSFNIGSIACHTPLTVQVLALERRLDLTLHNIDTGGVAVGIFVIGSSVSTEAGGFGADFVAYVFVEDCVAGWRDIG